MHAIVGILIFVIIAVAAIAIELVVRAADAAGANIVISYGLRVSEYGVFAADLGLSRIHLEDDGQIPEGPGMSGIREISDATASSAADAVRLYSNPLRDSRYSVLSSIEAGRD